MEVPSNGQTDPGEWTGEQPEIHPMIAKAFRALDGPGLAWVLLRGEDDLVRPKGDVDILVGEGSVQRVDAMLAGAGFRRVLAPGHGSHRFYFSYDAGEDLWLKLDVVSEISFGPYQQWHTPLALGCLKRRIRNGLLWLPATTEQAWLQLLHTMLDKGGTVRPERVDTVRVAGALASTDDAIAAYVDRQVGPGTAAQLLRLVRSGSVEDFRDPALRMASALTRNAPLRTRTTAGRNRVLRLISPTFQGRVGRGIVVGVVGPEAAVKTTPLRRLGEGFPVPARCVDLGMQEPGRGDSWAARITGGRSGQGTLRQIRGALTARYHSRRGRLVLVIQPANDSLPPGAAGAARATGSAGAAGAAGSAAGKRTGSALAVALAPRPDVLFVLEVPRQVTFAANGDNRPGALGERRQARLEAAMRRPNTWVIDAAQSQHLQGIATGILWRRVAESAPTQAAPTQAAPTQAAPTLAAPGRPEPETSEPETPDSGGLRP